MVETDRFDKVEVDSAEALWSWLGDHHARRDGVWLVTFKKSVPDRYVSRETVLDALVAFGWIDGVRRKLDDDRTMQLISPRRQQKWARTYKQRAERLEREGRMQPSGRVSVEQAKASGAWEADADIDALVVPDDLATALSGPADAYFTQAPPSYRRNVLRWIARAKRPATRAKRIAVTVEACARGGRIPQL